MKKFKLKLKSLFLCGALVLASCDLNMMPPIVANGIEYNNSAAELSAMVESIRNSNEYGSYIINKMEELGVFIEQGDTGTWGGFYYPDTNTIRVKEFDNKSLVHEMIHRLQANFNLQYDKRNMSKEEYILISLYSEFDAFYKSLCFEKYDILDDTAPFRAPQKLRDYYADYTLNNIPYEKYVEYYGGATLGYDKYNPEDLINNIDKTFIDFDETYVLTQLKEKIK